MSTLVVLSLRCFSDLSGLLESRGKAKGPVEIVTAKTATYFLAHYARVDVTESGQAFRKPGKLSLFQH
jgi:hypothetical protein